MTQLENIEAIENRCEKETACNAVRLKSEPSGICTSYSTEVPRFKIAGSINRSQARAVNMAMAAKDPK